jgi:hypothetical protein
MGRRAAINDDAVKVKLLWALRSGQNRKDAAATIDHPLGTVQGWIDKDPVLRIEVEAAEVEGTQARADKPVARDKATGADRWRKMREDAARFAPGMLGFLLVVDARVSAIPGNPPMSPFWRHAFTEFYQGEYHGFICVGGRGSAKSTNQIKVCANELLFRERHIPPMDPRWIWPFMSDKMAESNQRVQPFKSTLKALGVGESDMVVYERKDGRSEIQFDDAKGQPVKVNIFPNTEDACRGGNLAGATGDEVMHWIASKTDGLSKADDVNRVLVGALRADRSRVHIQISSVNDVPSGMLESAKRGSTALTYVATLGPFLRDALDGFERVAMHLDATSRGEFAGRIRAWAATLTASSPWIPSWVGNPTHDPVEGFELLFDKLRDGQDKIGIWLQENGSCFWPMEFVDGNYFEAKQIDRGTSAPVAPSVTVRATMIESTELRRSWTGMVREKSTGRVVEWHPELRSVDDLYEFVMELRPTKSRVRTIGTEYFAAIDTGAKKNPSALCIVERRVIEISRWIRYQWRPVVLRERRRVKGGLPLDLRMDVLPEFAALLREYGCASWWSDGWAGDAVEIVGAQNGIATKFVSTSTATRDVYEPIDTALAQTPCPVVLNGCENIEAAVAQLRQVKRSNDGKAIVPHVGDDHGELAVVLALALAHAGVGTLPPDNSASRFVAIPDRYSAFRGNGSRSYR